MSVLPSVNGDDLGTDLFVQELKHICNPTDGQLQINRKIGGGLIVEGFKAITALQLITLCRKYGKRFVVRLYEQATKLTIQFDAIPDYFDKSNKRASKLFISGNEELQKDSEATIVEKILNITSGVLRSKTQTKSTSLLCVQTERLTSDNIRVLQNIHQVVCITILPTHFEVTLMKENDSRTSLAFLKEHKPDLFTCVNKKRRYSVSKTSLTCKTTRKRVSWKKKNGSRLWHLL